MATRLWKYGIYSFLKVLREKLPASMEYMRVFISISSAMMSLLYESVSAFRSTWVEYYGDLARYRLATSATIVDREMSKVIACDWYQQAVDRSL